MSGGEGESWLSGQGDSSEVIQRHGQAGAVRPPGMLPVRQGVVWSAGSLAHRRAQLTVRLHSAFFLDNPQWMETGS